MSKKQSLRGAEGTEKTEVKCGECKKAVLATDQSIQCEVCDTWFHSKCEGCVDETYKLLNQDKIHFYCGRCDKVVGKWLKTTMEMKIKQDKLEVEVNKIKQEFVDAEHKNDAKINKLDADVKQFNLALHSEVNELKSDFEKMQGDLELLKAGMAKVEKQVFVKQKAEYDWLEKLAEKKSTKCFWPT